MNLSCEQTIWRRGVCVPALEPRGKREGLRTRDQGFKPDLGNSAVRHYRGASENVATAELRTHLATERVRVVTLRLKQTRPSSIPTIDRELCADHGADEHRALSAPDLSLSAAASRWHGMLYSCATRSHSSRPICALAAIPSSSSAALKKFVITALPAPARHSGHRAAQQFSTASLRTVIAF